MSERLFGFPVVNNAEINGSPILLLGDLSAYIAPIRFNFKIPKQTRGIVRKLHQMGLEASAQRVIINSFSRQKIKYDSRFKRRLTLHQI